MKAFIALALLVACRVAVPAVAAVAPPEPQLAVAPLAPPPTAASSGGGATTTETPRGPGCPVIYVYLDVSGSVFKALPEHGQRTGYELAIERIQTSLAPHIDSLGATLHLYRFGANVEGPVTFVKSDAFAAYIENIKRTPPNPQQETNLARVWEHILRTSGSSRNPSSFLVFSDFARSPIVGGAPAGTRSAGSQDDGEDLRAWHALIESGGDLIRAPVNGAIVRLVVLPAEEKFRDAQKRTLTYLTVFGSRISTRVLDVGSSDWDDFGTQVRYIDLSVEEGRLLLRNVSCATVTAEGLRVRPPAGGRFPQPPLHLSPGESGEWATPPSGRARASVFGRVGDKAEVLSNEVSFGLRSGDVSAFAFLIGKRLEIFITHQVRLGEAIEVRAEVLTPTGTGEKLVLRQALRIPLNAEEHAAPLREKLSVAEASAVQDNRHLGLHLRLIPTMGDALDVRDVPLQEAPPVQIHVGLLVLVLLALSVPSIALGLWVRPQRWERVIWALPALAAPLLAVGIHPLWLDGDWMPWLARIMGAAVGAWCGWCCVVAWPAVKFSNLEQIALTLDAPEDFRSKFLSRGEYERARIVGVVIFLLMGSASWWLLTQTYVNVADQRLPLRLLQKVAEGTITGQN